jgi:excisionase family DNA binding protein
MEMEIYTIPEVAQRLRINQTTVSRLIHRGELKAYKIGRIYRITKEEVDRFLNASKTETNEEGVPPHSSARSLLKYAGKWAGDDLEDCLKEVYAVRGKIEI